MTQSQFEFSPNATSFYKRLDIEEDASPDTIEKAGKLAFKQYAEGDRQKFLPLRKAREVLSDDGLREGYDTFCERLGYEVGTEAFNKWDSRGRKKNIHAFIEEYAQSKTQNNEEVTETASSEQNIWSQIEIDNPVIKWADGKPSGAIYVNLWTKSGKRLYINNLHPEGDIYLDLETGSFYTGDFDTVSDIEYNLRKSTGPLYIRYNDIQLNINLTGDVSSKPLIEDLEIESASIKSINFSDNGSLGVNYWEKGERLYIGGFYRSGTIYIDLETGEVRQDEDGDAEKDGYAENVYYDINKGGKEIIVKNEDRKLIISLKESRSHIYKKRKSQKNKQTKRKNQSKGSQKNSSKRRKNRKKRRKKSQGNDQSTSSNETGGMTQLLLLLLLLVGIMVGSYLIW